MMQLSDIKRFKPAISKGFIALALVTGLLTAVQFADPLEFGLSAMRNKVHSSPASGDIVLVTLPIETSDEADTSVSDVLSKLLDDGAQRIVLTADVTRATHEDERVRELFKAQPYRLFASVGTNGRLSGYDEIDVTDLVANDDQVLSQNFDLSYWGGVQSQRYVAQGPNGEIPTIEAFFAEQDGEANELFPVNYFIDDKTIPKLTSQEILNNPATAEAVLGKNILLSMPQKYKSDTLRNPARGVIAPSAVTILGAETLIVGRPIQTGGMPGWMLAILFIGALTKISRYSLRFLVGTIGALLLVFGPVPMQTFSVFFNNSGGLFTLLIGGLFVEIRNLINMKRGPERNPISGLITPNYWRTSNTRDTRMLISARVDHYSEMISTLNKSDEAELVTQIVNRLVIDGAAEIAHGEDGQFYWLQAGADLSQLSGHFEALNRLFRLPIYIADRALNVTVWFGVDQQSEKPLSARMPGSLAASKAARDAGTSWQLFDPEIASKKITASTMAGELRAALDADEVFVVYQPKIDLKNGNIIGVEALARWTHPERGPISPAEFVEVAEKHGTIVELTRHVLEKALILRKAIPSDMGSFSVAVNLSPVLLNRPNLATYILERVAEHGIKPSDLIIEITESSEIESSHLAIQHFETLKAGGVQLSVDDYGTGLSTLEYLKRIPASEIKIDRLFVTDVLANATGKIMLRSTVQLIQMLKLRCVVEGIEDQETLDYLASLGCDQGQGFLISKPLPQEDLFRFLARNKADVPLSA